MTTEYEAQGAGERHRERWATRPWLVIRGRSGPTVVRRGRWPHGRRVAGRVPVVDDSTDAPGAVVLIPIEIVIGGFGDRKAAEVYRNTWAFVNRFQGRNEK